ncbi:MAG TPA: TonB-dependent receptor [Rhizomicrobium sp.]
MYKSNLNNLSLRTVLLLGAAAAVGFATPALAQQDQSNGGVETVVVTGSLLSRADVETPSPVTILTSQSIQASGLTSTADVVRSLTSDNSGSIPTAFGNGFAAGSSGVALRGLTVNSTLVLVNGRRTANYPLADDGERAFVDLNTIPLDAVDRVEVVKDGASSIYGADAIAGVVNIIMKDEFQGVSGEAEYGTSEHGGGTMDRMSAMIGYGDMAADRFNAYINLEYEKDDAIKVGQRPFPFNTEDLSSIGGFDENNTTSIYGKVAPTLLSNPSNPLTGSGQIGNYQVLSPGGCGPKATQTDHVPGPPGVGGIDTYCEQDTALYTDYQPEQERYGVYSHMKMRFSNAATAYMDASYFQNQVWVDGGPPSIRTTAPIVTSNIALPAYLATGVKNPYNPFVNNNLACAAVGNEAADHSATCPDALIGYDFGDIKGGGYENDRVLQATVGLKGDWQGWTYDTAFVAAHSWLNTVNHGFLNYPQLESDIENGTYNFLDPSANTPAIRQALAPDLTKVSTTDEDSWDIRASHDLFALPGGEAQLGVSVEVRHEATFDPDLNPGLNALGLGIAHTIGNRNIYSASAELGMPITSTLEADVSGRFDHYSDFGDTFNPKVGLKWTPIPQVALRGTYSTGFRAPSFSENGTAESEGFITLNPCGASAGGTNFCINHAGDDYTKAYGFGLLSTANPNIKPEKARNYTFGTILTPFADIDLNGTVDYYNITKTNVIAPGNPGPAISAAFAGTPLPAGYTVVYDAPDPSFPGLTPRPVVIGSPYINASSLKTNGYDVNIHFGTDLMDGLHWSSNFDWTQIMAYQYSPSPGTTYSYVGTEAPYELSSGAGTPRDKASWANTFNFNPVSVTGTVYYTSGFAETGIDATGPTPMPPPSTAYYSSAICADGYGLYGSTLSRFCKVHAFWDFDLTARWHVSDSVDLFGSMRNVFDTKPPLDAADYAGINYNPTYSQDGIVGRFYSIGVSFKN